MATRASSAARSAPPTFTLMVRQPLSATAARAMVAATSDETSGMMALTSTSLRWAAGHDPNAASMAQSSHREAAASE